MCQLLAKDPRKHNSDSLDLRSFTPFTCPQCWTLDVNTHQHRYTHSLPFRNLEFSLGEGES